MSIVLYIFSQNLKQNKCKTQIYFLSKPKAYYSNICTYKAGDSCSWPLSFYLADIKAYIAWHIVGEEEIQALLPSLLL